MARSWFLLIKDDLPRLDAFLRKFVELYDALEDKHGFQDWFAAWWYWWCLQGLRQGRTVSAFSARFFYSAEEREEMFKLLNACIKDAEHPSNPNMKIYDPPPLTAAYQPYPFQLEPNYAYGPEKSVPGGVDEPHLDKAQTEALKEHFKKGLIRWRELRKNNLAARVTYDRRRAVEQGHDGPATPHQDKPGHSSTNPPFKTPNIAKCAEFPSMQKPLESQYMPDGSEQHAHASSSANSLAHQLLHNYSHRQRAIYGI
ncbi:hypothetical protein JCM10296v2_007786 [Rhodotorula toruloides]